MVPEINPEWFIDAQEHAKELDLSLVGNVHSHPYTHKETGNRVQDRTETEADRDSEKHGSAPPASAPSRS